MFGARVKSEASRRLLTRVRRPGLKRLVVHARSAWLAQEAEERCCYRSLIKTPDRNSEGPPRGGLSIFAVCTWRLTVRT